MQKFELMKIYYNHFCLKVQQRIEGVFYVGHRKKAFVDGHQTKYALRVITYNNKTPQKVKLRARQTYYRMID